MTDATAIPATRRQYRELVDGTLEVRIQIDPPYKQAFLKMFPELDMPVAIAPLVADFEQVKELARELNGTEQTDELKGGPLAKLAGILCNEPEFQAWLLRTFRMDIRDMNLSASEHAAKTIRSQCQIASRRELDHDARAARIFHEQIREPYLASQR